MQGDKPRLSIAPCADYSPDNLKKALSDALAPLGGMSAFVHQGQRVLLKPNFLSATALDKPLCTHTEFILAVADSVAGCGATVLIGDSPGLTTAATVAKKIGLYEKAIERGYRIIEFEQEISVKGATYHNLALSREVLEADVVINLPKFKTHGMMVLTLGVKNLYGCVVGKKKVQYHFLVKDSRERFADLLIDIAEAVKPSLSIIDGIIGMEGEGPSSGDPRQIGLIAAATEPWALDIMGARIAGYSISEVPVLERYARRFSAAGMELDYIPLGVPAEDFTIANWKKAPAFSISFKVPAFIRKPLCRLILPSPRVQDKICIGCGVCAKACPASVITITDGKVRIRLSDCIRCFCCAELCPHKAITIRKPSLSLGRS